MVDYTYITIKRSNISANLITYVDLSDIYQWDIKYLIAYF